MKIYLLIDAASVDEKPALCLSSNLASDIAENTGCRVIPIEFDLRVLVQEYFQFRGYVDPNAPEAFLFLSLKARKLPNTLIHGILN